MAIKNLERVTKMQHTRAIVDEIRQVEAELGLFHRKQETTA